MGLFRRSPDETKVARYLFQATDSLSKMNGMEFVHRLPAAECIANSGLLNEWYFINLAACLSFAILRIPQLVPKSDRNKTREAILTVMFHEDSRLLPAIGNCIETAYPMIKEPQDISFAFGSWMLNAIAAHEKANDELKRFAQNPEMVVIAGTLVEYWFSNWYGDAVAAVEKIHSQ